MGSMSIMHWAIVIGVVAILFGKNKISGLMHDVGGGIKALRQGMQEAAEPVPMPTSVPPPSPTEWKRIGNFTQVSRERDDAA